MHHTMHHWTPLDGLNYDSAMPNSLRQEV